MEDMFARIVLGHLAGDYLLQSRQMALAKSAPGIKGWLWCLAHCLIYTASLCLFLWTYRPLIVILVFFSHFPIDRWSLASKWLNIIRGRDFIAAYTEKKQHWEIDVAFFCLVYAVADNTLHLILLWFILKLV